MRDLEESQAYYQRGIADGAYSSADLVEAGNLPQKRLFRARVIMGMDTTKRTGAEDRWARSVIAGHVGSLIDERLQPLGKEVADVILKRWCMAILECEHAADPEQVIWSKHVIAHQRWF